MLPLFVSEKVSGRVPVASMPGVFQLSEAELVAEARAAHADGILAVLLFGIPVIKDELASQAYAHDGVVQRAVRALKHALPDLIVMTDVCLCEFMSHGHCGITSFQGDHAHVDNDASVELLARAAVSHAEAGADVVAPSDMMDGRVGVIRTALDAAGFHETVIMSYAAKFASAFYGPFRGALDSAPKEGDKMTYQMDPGNAREALREAEIDEREGADWLMVKPAGSYLDIISQVKNATYLPVVAYQVSGEYLMIKSAAATGWLNEDAMILESLLSIKRAGADVILTYFAKQAARLLGVS